jgi:hypothetical protein
MRTTKQKIISAVALFITVLTAQSVFAYYNPSTGRFLSRDPIGEPGFQALQMAQRASQVGPMLVAQQSSRWISRDATSMSADLDSDETGGTSYRSASTLGEPNIYAFVLNDPENWVDPVGLISFNGCSEQQKADITAAWKKGCEIVNKPEFACCVNRSGFLSLMKRRCAWGNMKFYCRKNGTFWCNSDTCAHSWRSIIGGINAGRIVVCDPLAWNCGGLPMSCLLMHELAHIVSLNPGHGDNSSVMKTERCCMQYQ